MRTPPRREWNVDSEDGDVGLRLCEELQEAQRYLRALSSPARAVDPVQVTKPFLSLLRATTLSGPYKLMALDTLQVFLKNGVLTEERCADLVAPALQDIVTAVTKCKFVQTDASVDEQVFVQLMSTLRALFAPALLRCMSNSVCWTAIEALHGMAVQATHALQQQQRPVLRRFAERALLESIEAVFSFTCMPHGAAGAAASRGNSNGAADSAASNVGGAAKGMVVESDSAASASVTAAAPVTVACAQTILKFYISIIQRYTVQDSVTASRTYQNVAAHLKQVSRLSVSSAWHHRVAGSAMGICAEMPPLLLALLVVQKLLYVAVAQAPAPASHASSSSSSSSSASYNSYNAYAPAHAHASNSLSATASADASASGAAAAAVSLPPVLVDLLRGDLGCCLVQLTRMPGLPVTVMQSVLEIFSSLYGTIGPISRVLVECFMKYVFLRALQEALALLRDDVHKTAGVDSSVGSSSGSGSGSGSGIPNSKYGKGGRAAENAAAAAAHAAEEDSAVAYFTDEQLGSVLGGLLDLLADVGFVPTLFASFDCDCAREDVVQPLVHLLGQCERYSIMYEYTPPVRQVKDLCRECLTQVLASLSAGFCRPRRSSSSAGSLGAAKGAGGVSTHSSDGTSTSTSSSSWVDVSNGSGTRNSKNAYGSEGSGANNNNGSASSNSNSNKAHPPMPPSPLDDDEHTQIIASSIRATRQTKAVLTRASELFGTKPEHAFDFLQQHGMLTKPLTPSSVAKFLRIAPSLSIEKIGAYLGELGAKSASHESATVEFHKQVLLDYIQSFEFAGQSLLNAVRIFLSAFLLPKEAQQIDRIFVAFSEHCHSSCTECVDGILQNTDVTYLMTISIIMLNTDRHNANIRADRKMTLEKFVLVNTNYGSDVKQTQDVPLAYLESIFHSINQFPLRTERNDLLSLHAVKQFSVAMWQDLQLQQHIYPERGFLTTPSFSPQVLELFSKEYTHSVNAESKAGKAGKAHKHGSGEPYQDIRNVGKSMLLNNARVNPLALSAAVHGKLWAFHGDIAACTWTELLDVVAAPFVASLQNAQGSGVVATASPQHALIQQQATRRALHVLDSVSRMAVLHSLPAVVDALVLLLADFAGLLSGGAAVNAVLVDALQGDYRSVRAQATAASSSGSGSGGEAVLMARLLTCLPARAALHAFLQLLQNYPDAVDRTWGTVWTALGKLRDAKCLPAGMVTGFEASDLDSLPPIIREAFDAKLEAVATGYAASIASAVQAANGGVGGGDEMSPMSPTSSPHMSSANRKHSRSRRSSSSSFFGYIFGSGSGSGDVGGGDEGSDDTETDKDNDGETGADGRAMADGYDHPSVRARESVSAGLRWDTGYEQDSLDSDALEEAEEEEEGDQALLLDPFRPALPAADRRNQTRNGGSGANGSAPAASAGHVDSRSSSLNGATVILAQQRLRNAIRCSGVGTLVSDTRFFTESTLLHAMTALSRCGDGSVSSTASSTDTTSSGDTVASSSSSHSSSRSNGISISSEKVAAAIRELTSSSSDSAGDTFQAGSKGVSSASLAWYEVVLVEAALRNRDRLSCIWALLDSHFRRQLSCVYVPGKHIYLHVVERAVTGLLKVAERVLGREGASRPVFALLGAAFGYPLTNAVKVTQPQTHLQLQIPHKSSSLASRRSTRSSGGPQGLPPLLQTEFAGHVSAGIWKIITKNVGTLPNMSNEAWGVLFKLVAANGGSSSPTVSGYAAIKSFEAMAWLLHEPRLRAEVPLICVSGIRPLVTNKYAPIAVSIGAVQLLMHLHGRVEVLATDAAIALSNQSVDIDGYDNDATAASNANASLSAAQSAQQALVSKYNSNAVLWENCWFPLLAALADGLQDTRPRVRDSAALAIKRALRDRQALAAPASVLVTLLGNVLAPAVTALILLVRQEEELQLQLQLPPASPEINIDAQYRAANTNASGSGEESECLTSVLGMRDYVSAHHHLQHSPGTSPKNKSSNGNSTSSWGGGSGSHTPNGSGSGNGNNGNDTGSYETPSREVLLRALQDMQGLGAATPASPSPSASASPATTAAQRAFSFDDPVSITVLSLCEAFARQTQKLAKYPSFDQLWLRVLSVLSMLLGGGDGAAAAAGTRTGSGTGISSGSGSAAAPPPPPEDICTSQPLPLTPAVITAQHCLLKCVHVLTSTGLFNDRAGLRLVTKEMVQAMALVPRLDGGAGDQHSDAASGVLSRL